MLYAIIYMLHYPDVIARVQQEIDDIIGIQRVPSVKDKQNMPYTEAVLLEIQRCAEIVPLGVPHTTLQVKTTKFVLYRLLRKALVRWV